MTDKHRSRRSFQVGEWVYFKIQPYRQVSVSVRPFNKLDARYFGPYHVEAKVCSVAYKFLMPANARIHHTFHVSQLKRCVEVPTILNHSYVFHLSIPYCLCRSLCLKGGW